jgi:hypothetical protein
MNAQISTLDMEKCMALQQAAACASAVTDMALICHKLALLSGWHSSVVPTGKDLLLKKAAMIALEHSELSESLEGVRKDTMDSHLPHRKAEEVEAADAIIRIFDRMALGGYDIGGAILEKLQYNARRADHTPEARAADNGKKF